MFRIITAALVATISLSSFAMEAPTVKLGGTLDTQFGAVNQKSPYNTSGGDKIHNSALVNSTRITANVDGNANGLKYGGYIKLFADTSPSSSGNANIADKVWTYVETKYGRLEGANTQSASNKMVINASDIARATGGIDGDANLWFNQNVTTDVENNQLFVISPGMPTFCKCKSASNKLVYYTPNFNGFQIGASFIIDPDFRGTVSKLHEVKTKSGDGFTNVFDVAARYENSYNGYEYALSIGGETAKSKNGTAHPHTDDLKALVVGAKVSHKGFTVAGSYADWFNTGRPKDRLVDGKFGSKHWTTGVAYEYKDFGVSLTHMKSINANAYTGKPVAKADQDKSYNTYEIISLGTDYKIAEGFSAYAELNRFEFKRAKSAVNNKGSVFLAGTKLSF